VICPHCGNYVDSRVGSSGSSSIKPARLSAHDLDDLFYGRDQHSVATAIAHLALATAEPFVRTGIDPADKLGNLWQQMRRDLIAIAPQEAAIEIESLSKAERISKNQRNAFRHEASGLLHRALFSITSRGSESVAIVRAWRLHPSFDEAVQDFREGELTRHELLLRARELLRKK
jgi:hypothetical protein